MNRGRDISVIVPTWNSAATIVAALDSALGSSRAPSEIIVVDDGSTDETVRVLAPYLDRIRYVYQENAGQSAARNRGLEISQGAMISFLDADDLFPPDALETLCAELDRDSQLQVAHGQTRDFRLDGGQLVLAEPRHAVNLGSALFRRSVFDTVGNFEESLRRGEDLDVWMRIREHGIHFRRIPAVAYYYRRYAARTTDAARHARTLAYLLKRSLDRTRHHSV